MTYRQLMEMINNNLSEDQKDMDVVARNPAYGAEDIFEVENIGLPETETDSFIVNKLQGYPTSQPILR